MTKANVRSVSIELVHDIYICRTALNVKRAAEFVQLMMDDASRPPAEIFPPILVMEDGKNGYVVIDGRTRLNAYEQIGEKTVWVEVLPKMPAAEVYFRAFRENFGGAAPMTFDDAKHTAIQLLDLGTSRKTIVDNLPYSRTRNEAIVANAAKCIVRRKCQQAVELMNKTPSLSSEHAADLGKVKLTELVSYRKSFAGGANGIDGGYKTNHLKYNIDKRFKSQTMFVAKTLSGLVEDYQEGKVNRAYAFSVLEEIGRRLHLMVTNHANWTNRFAQIRPKGDDRQPAFTEEKTKAGIAFHPTA